MLTKDEAFTKLAQLSINSASEQGIKFDDISLVCYVEYGVPGPITMFGYYYRGEESGMWRPKSHVFAISDVWEQLWVATKVSDKPNWRVCILKISVPRDSIDCDFLYGEDADIWINRYELDDSALQGLVELARL